MTIKINKEFVQPPDVVWQALTDARAIRQWWVDTDFSPEVGHKFYLRDVPQGSWDGLTTGTVLASEPPHYIRFSWVGGGHHLELSYRLTALPGGGTRLTLEHSGFAGLSGLMLSLLLRFGWGSYCNKLLPEITAHLAAHGFAMPFATPPKAARVRV